MADAKGGVEEGEGEIWGGGGGRSWKARSGMRFLGPMTIAF
jgi:hypothetical protein